MSGSFRGDAAFWHAHATRHDGTGDAVRAMIARPRPMQPVAPFVQRQRRTAFRASPPWRPSMKSRQAIVLAAVVAAFAAGSGVPAGAQGAGGDTLVHAKDLQWGPAPPSLPKGAQMAVLHGDPGKDGPFVLRLLVPKGYRIPPHWHSQDEQLTVISGTLYLGSGERFDAATARGLAAGGFHYLPAKARHYAYAKTPTIVQVNGSGPFDITYSRPDEDPRKAAR
jgi:quercetin dioxygenase-like cupin family protein